MSDSEPVPRKVAKSGAKLQASAVSESRQIPDRARREQRLLGQLSPNTRLRYESSVGQIPANVANPEGVRKEFLDILEYMQERKTLLDQKYNQDGQPIQAGQVTNVSEVGTPFYIETIIANLRAGNLLKPYIFAREKGFDSMIWNGQGGQALLNEYNQTFLSIDNDVLWEMHGRAIEEKVRSIWERSHSQEAVTEANEKNKKQAGEVTIQEGDILHGTATQYLADILWGGLWCDEAKYGQRRSSLGANYLSVAFGEAIPFIERIDDVRDPEGAGHRLNINFLALKTLYPFLRLGNQPVEPANNNDSFFVQYHGNMASSYGAMEPELARLHAIPQQWIHEYDDRKGTNDPTANITLIFRPQQEEYNGTGAMVGGTSKEVDVPFGIPATDLKGVVVNGRNEMETRQVLGIVATAPFYVPVYDCVTGDVLNPPREGDAPKDTFTNGFKDLPSP